MYKHYGCGCFLIKMYALAYLLTINSQRKRETARNYDVTWLASISQLKLASLQHLSSWGSFRYVSILFHSLLLFFKICCCWKFMQQKFVVPEYLLEPICLTSIVCSVLAVCLMSVFNCRYVQLIQSKVDQRKPLWTHKDKHTRTNKSVLITNTFMTLIYLLSALPWSVSWY